MPVFFVSSSNIDNERISVLDTNDIRHITSVLRLKEGDMLTISDDNGYNYQAKIIHINNEKIETKVVEKIKSEKKLKTNIVLAQSILKSAKQDIVLQKASELGVNKIIPFISRYTVVKFDNDKDKSSKVQRWQKICTEAAKQCERAVLPQVDNITIFNQILNLNGFDIKIACVERELAVSLKEALTLYPSALNILIILGPEGGWSPEEKKMLQGSDIISVSLGNIILRAETAAIAVISNVIYEYEQ